MPEPVASRRYTQALLYEDWLAWDDCREFIDGVQKVGPGMHVKPKAARQTLRLPWEREHDPGMSLKLALINFSWARLAVQITEVGMGVHAVSFHMRNIYEKLQVHSKAEAVAKALRHRIVR